MRLSLTARTPGVTSAAMRTAFFSDAESTIPHSSTVPSCTITLINEGLVHGSALSCVSTLSRICESSTPVATSARLLRLAKACSRFARLTMPTTLPFSTIGTRLIAFFSSRSAIFQSEVSGAAVTTLARHHIGDLARMLPHEFHRQRLFAHEDGEPPRSPAAGTRLDAPHEIAFADDTDELAVCPDDWNAADPRGQQNMSDVLDAGIGTHRDHVPNHYVGGFHGTSPLPDQLLSLTGEFFDLNQEMGTVFRGSLAPISTMRGSGGSNAREASDAGGGHRPGDAGRAWRGAGDRTSEPRPRSRPAAMRGMSCGAKRILAIPERQCASLSGDRLHSRHDRNRVIGCTQ